MNAAVYGCLLTEDDKEMRSEKSAMAKTSFMTTEEQGGI